MIIALIGTTMLRKKMSRMMKLRLRPSTNANTGTV